jgi:hypothetical protein
LAFNNNNTPKIITSIYSFFQPSIERIRTAISSVSLPLPLPKALAQKFQGLGFSIGLTGFAYNIFFYPDAACVSDHTDF